MRCAPVASTSSWSPLTSTCTDPPRRTGYTLFPRSTRRNEQRSPTRRGIERARRVCRRCWNPEARPTAFVSRAGCRIRRRSSPSPHRRSTFRNVSSVLLRSETSYLLLHPLICQPFDDRALSFGRVDGAVGRLRLTDCFPFHQFSSCTRICGEARIPARSKIDGNRGLSRGRSVTFDDGTRTNRADNDGIARCRPIYAPRRTED